MVIEINYMDFKFYVTDDDTAYTEFRGVKGTLTQGDVMWLVTEAQNLEENSVYAETGSYLGCSSTIIASLAKKGIRVYAHDLWLEDMKDLARDGGPPPVEENYFYQFYDNVRRNALEGVIIPMRGDSAYTLGVHKDESIDLAFIDGDHSYDGVTRDLEMVLPKMKKTGKIMCHDCFPLDNPVTRAVEDFGIKHGLKMKNAYHVGSRIIMLTH